MLIKVRFQRIFTDLSTVINYSHYYSVDLILCSSVVYTARRFMFGLALLFVYVFFCPFSILITLIGEEGAGLCAYRAFVC